MILSSCKTRATGNTLQLLSKLLLAINVIVIKCKIKIKLLTECIVIRKPNNQQVSCLHKKVFHIRLLICHFNPAPFLQEEGCLKRLLSNDNNNNNALDDFFRLPKDETF